MKSVAELLQPMKDRLAKLRTSPTDQAKLIAAVEAVEDWCKNLDVVESTNPGVLNVRADGIADVLRKVITQALGGDTA